MRRNPWFPDSEKIFSYYFPRTHSFPYVQINKWRIFINLINGGLVGGRTYQDGHSVLVSDILDIPILNNLIADFSTDPRYRRLEESYCLVQKGFRYYKYYFFDVLIASVLTDPLTPFEKSFFCDIV